MSITNFDRMLEFRDIRQPCATPYRSAAETIEAWGEEAPEDLTRFWELDDLRCYDNGLLWFVDPGDFAGLLDRHFPEFEGRRRAYCRDAFGYLYLYDTEDAEVYGLDCIAGDLTPLAGGVALVARFAMVGNYELEDEMDDIHLRTMFHEARERVGPIGSNQCYAFVPALALGGPGTVDTIEIADVQVHFDFLLQLARS